MLKELIIKRLSHLALHWQIAIAMVIGAFLGTGLNMGAGDRRSELGPSDLPGGYRQATIHDTPGRIEIELVPVEGPVRRWVIGGDLKDRASGALATPDELKTEDAVAYELFQVRGRSWARWIGDGAHRLGGLFLRLLKMVSIPLIVTSLGTGVMGLGHARSLGRMFSRTFLYYMATSMLAIVTGLVMVNLFQPGIGSPFQPHQDATPAASQSVMEILFQQLETLIPPNPIEALSSANFLSIISFTILFSICTLLVGGQVAERLRRFFADAFDVMMKMTNGVIKLAPAGVFFLMLYVTATQGMAVFISLGQYMITVLAALGFHALIVLPLIVRLVAGRNPWEFAKAMSPALLTAFSSASSNGTLPLTMSCVEQRAGVSNRVSSFVLPLGATINMDGTALYEAIAVLFIAQVYHGANLPLAQQIIVAVTALLASVGAAGIPHAGLVMMVVILHAVGLPVNMLGIILAVDRVLDMCRTSVNVWSDSCGCAVVARLERGFES